MSRAIVFGYGLLAYAACLATLLYAIGFVGGFVVPRSVDSGGASESTGLAIVINIVLLALFAIQHTIMARPGFKRWWTTIIPKAAERSTFVLASSLLMMLMYWQWRPLPAEVWRVEHIAGQWILWGLFAIGWALVFYSSFVIDHFDLFGLRQVWLHLRGRPYVDPPFKEPRVYKLIRHPLMAGFLIAFWATPTMTLGHLVLAVVITAYTLVGVQFEERDMLSNLGEDYREYRRRTPMLVPWMKRRPANGAAQVERPAAD